MAWARVDDRFPAHPKALKAGPQAAYLYLCSLCYCNAQLTDGFVPENATHHIAPGLSNVKRLTAKLVEVGLWETAEGGYRVHDYLEYNKSAKEVRADRAASTKRVTEWRARHRGNAPGGTEPNAVTVKSGNDVTPAACNSVGNAAPIPSPPHPIEKKKHPEAAASGPSWEEFLVQNNPEAQEVLRQVARAIAATRKTRNVAPSVLNALAKKMATYPATGVLESCRTYLDRDCAAEGKDERYLLGILRNQTKHAGENGASRISANRNGSSRRSDGDALIERATQELFAERGWS